MVKFPAKTTRPLRHRDGLAAALLALGCATGAWGHPISLDGEPVPAEAAPYFQDARQISLSGVHRGIDVGSPDAEACRAFRMTDRQIKLYFKLAQSISVTEFNHTQDWRPCHVAGQARIDGLAFDWKISASGVAQAWRRPEQTHDLILACEDACHRKVFGRKR